MQPQHKNKNVKLDVVHELHHSARKNFPRRSFEMRGINDTFQIDLVEMIPYAKENKGFKYLLVVIDTFSKYAWIKKLKNKSGPEVTSAMQLILNENPARIPINIQSDMGKEFYNSHFQKLMKRYHINHYSTFSHLKASIVERFNRTFLNKLWQQFSLQGSHKWLSLIDVIVYNYNHTKHRTIKMRPIDVNVSNEAAILKNIYGQMKKTVIKTNKPQKFNVGDYVRISKYKSVFEKGYTPNWSTEIFKIVKILPTNPTTYTLSDLDGSNIRGCFYEYELLKTRNKDIYLVEKIVKRNGRKLFVKWLGFDETKNSWIDKKDLI